MKIISKSRFDSMQKMIAAKSDMVKRQGNVISLLEQENIKQAARIAELEGLLYGYGLIDRAGQVSYDSDERVKIVTAVLDRMEQEDAGN